MIYTLKKKKIVYNHYNRDKQSIVMRPRVFCFSLYVCLDVKHFPYLWMFGAVEKFGKAESIFY